MDQGKPEGEGWNLSKHDRINYLIMWGGLPACNNPQSKELLRPAWGQWWFRICCLTTDFRSFLSLMESVDSCWHWWEWVTGSQSCDSSEGLPELIPVSVLGHKLPLDIGANTGPSPRATRLSYFKEMSVISGKKHLCSGLARVLVRSPTNCVRPVSRGFYSLELNWVLVCVLCPALQCSPLWKFLCSA